MSDDPDLDEVDVLERATELGTSFDPGRPIRDEVTERFAMRLSSCNVPEESMDEAIQRLARAVSMCPRKPVSALNWRPSRAATP
jgi:DNA-binding transcriptional MocR family regulator